MEELARAKVNLALHVRGREPDGYHRIETLFAFLEEGDRLRVEEGEGLSLSLEGPFAAQLGLGEDNLVLRAAAALRRRFGIKRGARLTLEKNLPVASGIGGGSADAAAALRLLDRWWGIGAGEAALIGIARTIGADVPACLLSRTVLGTGRGDVLAEADRPELRGTPILLVNPGVAVSTAEVFRLWHGEDGGPLPVDLKEAQNDLEPLALRLAPAIGEVLESLRRAEGTVLARMSGSGATCFALFGSESHRDAAAEAFATSRPAWWSLASRLV
jgi:4-diphosphocytidyl-2-C-methyl-D-erythritol kinase